MRIFYMKYALKKKVGALYYIHSGEILYRPSILYSTRSVAICMRIIALKSFYVNNEF